MHKVLFVIGGLLVLAGVLWFFTPVLDGFWGYSSEQTRAGDGNTPVSFWLNVINAVVGGIGVVLQFLSYRLSRLTGKHS